MESVLALLVVAVFAVAGVAIGRWWIAMVPVTLTVAAAMMWLTARGSSDLYAEGGAALGWGLITLLGLVVCVVTVAGAAIGMGRGGRP